LSGSAATGKDFRDLIVVNPLSIDLKHYGTLLSGAPFQPARKDTMS